MIFVKVEVSNVGFMLCALETTKNRGRNMILIDLEVKTLHKWTLECSLIYLN